MEQMVAFHWAELIHLILFLIPTPGKLVYSGGGQITTDKNLTLTYQAANGDTFVETIVIDHDLNHASIYESVLNVRKSGYQLNSLRPW